MRGGARSAGLVIGVLADAVFGDPRRGHPVAAFGAVAAALERRVWRDSVAAGAVYTAVLTGGAVALGVVAERAVRGAGVSLPAGRPSAGRSSGGLPSGLRSSAGRSSGGLVSGLRSSAGRSSGGRGSGGGYRRPGGGAGKPGPRRSSRPGGGLGRAVAETGVVAVATWAVLGGTSLVREGEALGRSLEAGDLDAARARIPHLCARDPALLDAAGMARAGVESVAENTSDAVLAPLFWGAVAGVPGLLGYRAVNTLDAMVGYRSARYARFGRVAARLDDVVNLVPARITAVLTVLLAPAVGGAPADALRAWCRDAGGHPSPNAGPVEATAAGALGLRLGGRTEYAYGAENRPALGDGRAPDASDLRRAARLSRLLGVVGVLAAAGLAAGRRAVIGGSGRDATEVAPPGRSW